MSILSLDGKKLSVILCSVFQHHCNQIVCDPLLSLPAPLQSVCSCDDKFETTDVCPAAFVHTHTMCRKM